MGKFKKKSEAKLCSKKCEAIRDREQEKQRQLLQQNQLQASPGLSQGLSNQGVEEIIIQYTNLPIDLEVIKYVQVYDEVSYNDESYLQATDLDTNQTNAWFWQ